MTAVINPAKYLAADVVFYALVDLVHQNTAPHITSADYDDAARFFAENNHVGWCYMADIDPDAVKEYAVRLAVQYKLWTEHPHLYKRPRIQIPFDEWRKPIN